MEKEALKEHVRQNLHVYKPGVLKVDEHYRLVLDLQSYAEKANIPALYIYTSMKNYCGEVECDWVRSLTKHAEEGIAGLVYTGPIPHVEDRMMAIAGACLRNYIAAQVMPLQEVVERMKTNSMPVPRVLLIPNFFLKKDGGGDIPSWQVSSLLGLLYARFAKGLQTVLYVQNMHNLGETYGVSFTSHITGHYTRVDAKDALAS